MKITILDCPKSKHGRYHLIYGLNSWPAGTIKNRGWNNASILYERQATPEEAAEQENAWRFLCYRYREWGELVKDEAKYGIDANAELKQYQRGEAG